VGLRRIAGGLIVGVLCAVGATVIPVGPAVRAGAIPAGSPVDPGGVVEASVDGSRVILGPTAERPHPVRLDLRWGEVDDLPPGSTFSQDLSAMITADGRWYDIDTGASTPVPARTRSYWFTSDGRTYLASTPGGALLVDGATGWTMGLGLRPLAMSPNGRYIATETTRNCAAVPGGPTCDVDIFDLATNRFITVASATQGERLASDVADTGRVLILAFTAGGTMYTAVDLDGSRRIVGTFQGGAGSADLSNDGMTALMNLSVTSCCVSQAVLSVGTGTLGPSVPVFRPSTDGVIQRMSGDGGRLVQVVVDFEFVSPRGSFGYQLNTIELSKHTVRAVHAQQSIAIEVGGELGVPSFATAVMLNVAMTDPRRDGFLTVWPCDGPRPLAANVNVGRDGVASAAVLSGIAEDGTICLSANVDANVVIDVNGWFDDESGYEPVTPRRLADTRVGSDDGRPTLPARGVLAVPVAAGAVAADVMAVVLSVVAVDPAAAGFLTVWPCGEPMPLAANVTFAAHETRANAVVATPGSDGNVCVAGNVDTDVVVDLDGWLTADADFLGGTPLRIVDSREGELDAVPNLAPEEVVQMQLADWVGVAVVDLAVTNASADGFVTVWPCAETRPLVSNLNFVAGATVTNLVFAAGDEDGKVCFASNVAVDLVVDLEGLFGFVSYQPVVPARLLDTRT